MRAATIANHGADILMKDVSTPQLHDTSVRIAIEAAALNHLDLFVHKGLPGVHLQFPHIMGSDAVGTVMERGAAVPDSVQIGQRVLLDPALSCGSCEQCSHSQESQCIDLNVLGEHIHGTLAEQCVLPWQNVVTCPDHLQGHEAAALPLTFVTAWRMLISKAQLSAGMSVLIQGIGGGVSLAAFQLAKAHGARLIVTSRSQKKIDRALELGAEVGFLSGDDVGKKVRHHTDKRGVDVVVDSVGQATWEQSLLALAKGGRLVTCGATSGPRASTDVNRLFWNQLSIFGSTLGNRQEFASMVDYVNTHALRPVVDTTFELNDIQAAYDRLRAADQFGKIVITMNGKHV